MNDQSTINAYENTSFDSKIISQPTMQHQDKTNLVLPILLSVLVSAIIFGFGGYYFGARTVPPKQQTILNQPVPTNLPLTASIKPSSTPKINSNLIKYISSFEKLSFEYPADWVKTPIQPQSNNPNGDALGIQDPNGLVTVNWISEIDGLGGGCDPNIEFGKEGENGAACPLYEIVEIQKLDNVDLYYVAYLVTRDGKSYIPGFALQDKNGLMSTKRTLFYPIFNGRNNGKLGVELSGIAMTSESAKDQAINFFQTPEAKIAKNVLLSASY